MDRTPRKAIQLTISLKNTKIPGNEVPTPKNAIGLLFEGPEARFRFARRKPGAPRAEGSLGRLLEGMGEAC